MELDWQTKNQPGTITVNIVNTETPEIIVVIILKFEQGGLRHPLCPKVEEGMTKV